MEQSLRFYDFWPENVACMKEYLLLCHDTPFPHDTTDFRCKLRALHVWLEPLMPCSLFKILHRNEAIELKTSIHFPVQSFTVLLYTNQKQKIEFDYLSYVCLWINDKSTSNHISLCSVSLGNNAIPGKRSHGANILGPTRVQHFVCHYCLLVNCLCGKYS